MIGSPGTRRVATAVVLLLAAAACGDDDSAANPERFCEIINTELEQLGDPFELAPDEAREVVRSSVEAVADSFTPYFDLMEAADFDVAQVDEAELDALFNDEVFADQGDDGLAAVDEWMATNCSA
jgi:hypothetical protein